MILNILKVRFGILTEETEGKLVIHPRSFFNILKPTHVNKGVIRLQHDSIGFAGHLADRYALISRSPRFTCFSHVPVVLLNGCFTKVRLTIIKSIPVNVVNPFSTHDNFLERYLLPSVSHISIGGYLPFKSVYLLNIFGVKERLGHDFGSSPLVKKHLGHFTTNNDLVKITKCSLEDRTVPPPLRPVSCAITSRPSWFFTTSNGTWGIFRVISHALHYNTNWQQ